MTIDVLGAATCALNILDWDDLPSVAAASDQLLGTLDADRALLSALAANVAVEPVLARLSEHYDILDKIVLLDHPTGWRLRLLRPPPQPPVDLHQPHPDRQLHPHALHPRRHRDERHLDGPRQPGAAARAGPTGRLRQPASHADPHRDRG
jgi:hypothetical protein